MKFVYVGKIVNTHGLKGELRILSTFSHKEKVFVPGFLLYVNDKPYEIQTVRKHKNYDMVTFKGYNDINEVLFLKGEDAYFNRSDIDSNIILDSDLIGFKMISTNGKEGVIDSVEDGIKYSYLLVSILDKKYYVPKVDEFIEKIDLEKQVIYIKEIEGLFDENWYINSFS